MNERSFHVIIVGGGLGGLCLAQGLKKAGVNVAVYERDRTRTDRLQGYRIHIDPDGSRALHECLPLDLFNAFDLTGGVETRGFNFLTHRLEELLHIDLTKVVVSDPIALNQTEPRLIEVQAWVKTDRLAMLQIDAQDDKGQRLDGFNFIQKMPFSIGTNDWRLIRQVFRPRQPLKSVRLKLCARGVNGYTLKDTGAQPQNNVTGTIWWDGIRLTEPESSAPELQGRGVKAADAAAAAPAGPSLENLDLGERLLGLKDRKSTRLNSSHRSLSRMPSSA